MVLKLGNYKKNNKIINISRKERNLLLVLAVTILFWASYQYILIPQKEVIIKLKEEKTANLNELTRINNIISKEDVVNKEVKGLAKEFEAVSKKYFSKTDQPVLIHMLNNIIDNGFLKVPSIHYTEPEKIDELDASRMEASIPFAGTYKDLNMLFSQLEDSQKKLLVSQLSLNKDSGEVLNGQIVLDAYSYEDESVEGEGYFYVNPFQGSIKENPFKPFEGYVEEEVDILENTNGAVMDDEKRYIINDMEGSDVYFIGTSSEVTGKVSILDKSKYGSSSIRVEYFISSGYKSERAYVVLDDKEITLKYPPQSIGVWAYGYGYSPATIGFRFKDLDGRNIDVEIKKGVNWNGWEYISAAPPQDINIYPLKLDRIYFELGANKDDYGVMLFDRIECTYPLDENSNLTNKSFIFYTVKAGDTLTSISEIFYGTKSEYIRIMKENGLEPKSKLLPGEVLVIPK